MPCNLGRYICSRVLFANCINSRTKQVLTHIFKVGQHLSHISSNKRMTLTKYYKSWQNTHNKYNFDTKSWFENAAPCVMINIIMMIMTQSKISIMGSTKVKYHDVAHQNVHKCVAHLSCQLRTQVAAAAISRNEQASISRHCDTFP